MTVTIESFLAANPNFALKSPEQVGQAIEFAMQDCPISMWKDYCDRGVTLKTAHLLAMDWYETASISGSAIPLAGGQPAHAPGGASGDDGDLDLTTWGRQFKMLRRQVVGSPATFLSGF